MYKAWISGDLSGEDARCVETVFGTTVPSTIVNKEGKIHKSDYDAIRERINVEQKIKIDYPTMTLSDDGYFFDYFTDQEFGEMINTELNEG